MKAALIHQLDWPLPQQPPPKIYKTHIENVWTTQIEAARAATLNDGVKDGAAFAGIGIAEEEPVFLSKRGGTNGGTLRVDPAPDRPSLPH
jgi:hypothetical protein